MKSAAAKFLPLQFLQVLGVVFSLAVIAAAQTPNPSITQLFGFPCDATLTACPQGSFPNGLLESPDGNFYGITVAGGTGLNSQGTVFKITPNGQLTVIYNFAERSDGSLPNGAAPTSLVEGTDGFLYGTTLLDGGNGQGTVFKLSKSGTITDLHDFCATLTCNDGANPAFLMQALDGNFYGVTGPTLPPTSVLFRISPTGTFKALHNFDLKSQPDGSGAFGMLQAPDGNFYGATVAGSQTKPFNTVFRFNPNTSTYTILHGFLESNAASSNLVLASNGQLFGLQTGGILYRISPTGAYRKIGPIASNQSADGDILLASDGNLWGDSFNGGTNSAGLVFATTTAGSVLQNLPFTALVNGNNPSSILQAADGEFYGVTFQNGAPTNGQPSNGTVWTIDAGLPAPRPTVVNFAPTSGTPGTKVLLQGSHFVNTSSVSFNGVGAAFTVLSANYIRAIVPAGATTGPITISNAGGATSSVKTFSVH